LGAEQFHGNLFSRDLQLSGSVTLAILVGRTTSYHSQLEQARAPVFSFALMVYLLFSLKTFFKLVVVGPVENVEKLLKALLCLDLRQYCPVENLWKKQPTFPQGIYTYESFPPILRTFHRFSTEFSTEIRQFSTGKFYLKILNEVLLTALIISFIL
jgi:hypothetical protein